MATTLTDTTVLDGGGGLTGTSTVGPDINASTTPATLHEFNSSFLQHASGKGIAGACAWAAIFITCHQVESNKRH